MHFTELILEYSLKKQKQELENFELMNVIYRWFLSRLG